MSGALFESLLLFGMGLSLWMTGLLACVIVMRRDSIRERSRLRDLLTGVESGFSRARQSELRSDSARGESTAAGDQLGAIFVSDLARLQAGVAEAVSSGINEAETRMRLIVAAEGDRTSGEVQAFLRLCRAYESVAVPLPMGPNDAAPSQILKVVEIVDRVNPSSVITSSLTHGAIWVAHALRSHGHVSVLCSDLGEVRHLEEVARADALEQDIRVVHAPMTRVNVPHHYLPWHDLAGLGPERAFDFAVVSGNGVDDRSILPFLPLLRDRLTPRSVVAVLGLSSRDGGAVLSHWVEEYSMSIEEELSSDGVTVLRSS